MPHLSYACVCCHCPAEDEYHWWHEEKDGTTHEIVWKLCSECLQFAEEVVECVSNLDDEKERELWK